MASLLLADLHFTDKAKDEYRWALFPWLKAQVAEHNINTIYILGDVTDAKDRHNAKFTNRLINELVDLSLDAQVIITMGNHDYLDPTTPFFGFLDGMANITYVKEPMVHHDPELGKLLLLPHSRTPEADFGHFNFSEYAAVFVHQSVIGAIASEFYEISHGLSHHFFDDSHKTWAGDIHCPQRHGKLEYIASPYHVHFGDLFEPRVVMLEDDATTIAKELYFPAPQRVTLRVKDVDELTDYDLQPGDQVKVHLTLAQSDVHLWNTYKKRIKAHCVKNNWQFHGCQLHVEKLAVSQKQSDAHTQSAAELKAVASPQETLLRFAKTQALQGELLDKAKKLMQSVD
ncbi:metallophosphoesterase [Pseudoalteromonas umbrosa]|uniref:metallophosphoesterase n=1 Tax=Pseudoalteromonas umbrosa TaxID=3048489 RepID=UPI0024C2257F|nr:metallophosphoesterase [Pseudoalteromonas sp. B95]MDK1290121.1 metallophosphoesterase [Pseudoalteromonas sp. B95]